MRHSSEAVGTTENQPLPLAWHYEPCLSVAGDARHGEEVSSFLCAAHAPMPSQAAWTRDRTDRYGHVADGARALALPLFHARLASTHNSSAL